MNIINTSRPFAGVMSSFIGGRTENQDTCGFSDTESGLLAVVCDGMGGGPGGKTASTIAVSTIIEYVQTNGVPGGDKSQLMTDAVIAANQALRDKIRECPELDGMGTTVVAILFDGRCATIVHVGDSRAYQMRDKSCVFCTQDHSRVGEMVRSGALTKEQARLSAFSNIITRALGIGSEVDVEVDVRPYEKDDRFILCTDGIWGAMAEKELFKEFTGEKNLEGTLDVLNLEVEKCGKLNKDGHHDNYTAIIIKSKANSILKEPMSKKVKLLLQALGIVCAISIICNIIMFALPKPKEQLKSLNEQVETLTKERDALKDSIAAMVAKPVKTVKKEVKETVKEEPKPAPVVKVEEEKPADNTEKITAEKQKADEAEQIKDAIGKLQSCKTYLVDNFPQNNTKKQSERRKTVVGDLEEVRKKLPEAYQKDIKYIIDETNKNSTISQSGQRAHIGKKILELVAKLKKDYEIK